MRRESASALALLRGALTIVETVFRIFRFDLRRTVLANRQTAKQIVKERVKQRALMSDGRFNA